MLKNKIETIEEFYRGKFDWMPDNLKNEIGHFNIFKLEPFVPGIPISIPYKRRDYYKIMLVMGNSEVHYGDKVVEIKKQALSFSSPQIPPAILRVRLSGSKDVLINAGLPTGTMAIAQLPVNLPHQPP